MSSQSQGVLSLVISFSKGTTGVIGSGFLRPSMVKVLYSLNVRGSRVLHASIELCRVHPKSNALLTMELIIRLIQRLVAKLISGPQSFSKARRFISTVYWYEQHKLGKILCDSIGTSSAM